MKTIMNSVAVTYVEGRNTHRLECDCGGFSATRGDYWMQHPATVLHCDECGENLRLMRHAYAVGHLASGEPFSGMVWVLVSETVTPADLPD